MERLNTIKGRPNKKKKNANPSHNKILKRVKTNLLCDLQISKRIMFVLRDSPMSHPTALIFFQRNRKSRQASESDSSLWRSAALQSRLTERRPSFSPKAQQSITVQNTQSSD